MPIIDKDRHQSILCAVLGASFVALGLLLRTSSHLAVPGKPIHHSLLRLWHLLAKGTED